MQPVSVGGAVPRDPEEPHQLAVLVQHGALFLHAHALRHGLAEQRVGIVVAERPGEHVRSEHEAALGVSHVAVLLGVREQGAQYPAL